MLEKSKKDELFAVKMLGKKLQMDRKNCTVCTCTWKKYVKPCQEKSYSTKKTGVTDKYCM